MNQYSVKITDKALVDMESIYNYIALDLQVPDTAMGQYNRIAAPLRVLRIHPSVVGSLIPSQSGIWVCAKG